MEERQKTLNSLIEEFKCSTETDIDEQILADENKKEKVPNIKRHVFGIGALLQNNVEFVSETEIVYPVANHLVIYDTDKCSMNFFEDFRDIQSVVSFSTSQNGHLISVCERVVSNSINRKALATIPVSSADSYASSHDCNCYQVSVYQISSRLRVSVIPLSNFSRVISCSFSSDNKYLTMLHDSSCSSITYWKWNTAKLIATSAYTNKVTRIRLKSLDSNIISISGPNCLKYYTMNSNELKQGNFLTQAKEMENFVDHLWIKTSLLAITDQGNILIFSICETSAISFELTETLKFQHSLNPRLETISSYNKGFIVAGSGGAFNIYEKTNNLKDPFILIHSFAAGSSSIGSICISPSCEKIVAYTKNQHILTFPTSGIDMIHEDSSIVKEITTNGCHFGPILSMDLCCQRPIIVTCGLDKTARVWNYYTYQCELVHQCVEEINSISLHPAGFQLILAFKERIRIYVILHDGLRILNDIAVKSSNKIQYAFGGHIFACASGMSIFVYKSYNCEILHTFTGHVGTVKCIVFSENDFWLYSAGNDGCVYCWDISSGSRVSDMQHVVKQCKYSALVADRNNNKLVVASGSDGILREILSGEESKSIDIGRDIHATQLLLLKSNRRLLVATSNGSVLIYTWPLVSSTYQEFVIHSSSITKLSVTDDESKMISSSDDGSICISSLGDMLNEKKIEKKNLLTDSILISREDIEEKNEMLLDLQLKYEQVKSDTEYSLHRKDIEWLEKIREIKEEHEEILRKERKRFDELQLKADDFIKVYDKERAKDEASHVSLSQELENKYEHKLAIEMAKFEALSEEIERMRQRSNAVIESEETQHKLALQNERRIAGKKIHEQNTIIRQLHDDLKYNQVKFEEVLSQQEAEYELELQKLKLKSEKELEIERQNTAMKQGELTAMNNKLDALKKKMLELKTTSHGQDIVLATEKEKNRKLEDTLTHLEQHMDEREGTLSNKEKSILSLRATNRTLENFRYVLDHRVQQLHDERDPIQQHLTHLEGVIQNMQDEMLLEHQQKDLVDAELSSRDKKIKILSNEVTMLRNYCRDKDYSIGQITRELTRIVHMNHPKDIEDAVKDAYKIFVNGEKISRQKTRSTGTSKQVLSSNTQKKSSQSSTKSALKIKTNLNSESKDADEIEGKNLDSMLGYDEREVVKESNRQISHMHKSVTTLTLALKNTKQEADLKHRRNIAEGNILINDCNTLRKENKLLALRIKELETMMKLREDKSRTSLRPESDQGRQRISSRLTNSCSESDIFNKEDQVQASKCQINRLTPIASPIKNISSPQQGWHSPKKKVNGKIISGSCIHEKDLFWKGMNSMSVSANNQRNINDKLVYENETQKKEILRLRHQVELLLNNGIGQSVTEATSTRGLLIKQACIKEKHDGQKA